MPEIDVLESLNVDSPTIFKDSNLVQYAKMSCVTNGSGDTYNLLSFVFCVLISMKGVVVGDQFLLVKTEMRSYSHHHKMRNQGTKKVSRFRRLKNWRLLLW
ncbi:hypothetical protein CEXT_753281 [Caerostris extrusa]|uniref:Uncharacterized protein n=1 Tax=Caerostris extrusa TaxID=172846 RepID=A0AAV4M541_CAEEX|nr:hypothetical protein CEXT_753281 [Caerostris extrusa]